MKKIIFLFSVALTTAFTNANAGVDPAKVITNFHEVAPQLYRGARPSDDGLQALADAGVRTVLSFDDVTNANAHEAKVAKKLGMTSIAIPMNSIVSPSDEKMEKIRAILLDPSNKPLFVHCKHGEDRTGLVVGLYRFQDQKWSAEDAYNEMEQLGFHKILFGLYRYFKEVTGYDDDFVGLTPAQVASAKIPNFSKVDDGIYRGGRPSKADLKNLVKDGFKTVLSLEIPSTVKKERKMVEDSGMKFISIPMSVYKAPTDDEMDEVLGYLTDSKLQPILVHCLHGEDRTGLVVGIYRTEVDKVDPKDAYKEMVDQGFHTKYKPLVEYFADRTGYKP